MDRKQFEALLDYIDERFDLQSRRDSDSIRTYRYEDECIKLKANAIKAAFHLEDEEPAFVLI